MADTPAGPSVIVILGQSLNRADGSVPQTLLNRVVKGVELYRRERSLIIVTGADPAGVGRTEAQVMKQLLVERGVAEADVLLEEQAKTTAENAGYCLQIIRGLIERGPAVSEIRLVTSDFHMPRSWFIFVAVFREAFHIVEYPCASGLPETDLPGAQAEINLRSLRSRLECEEWIFGDLIWKHLRGLSPPIAEPPRWHFDVAQAKLRVLLANNPPVSSKAAISSASPVQTSPAPATAASNTGPSFCSLE